jgi:hypothetical protein
MGEKSFQNFKKQWKMGTLIKLLISFFSLNTECKPSQDHSEMP